MFRENRPSISHETLLAYQFPGFSDTTNPQIPDAAKTAIRQSQEQLRQQQAELANIGTRLQGLKTDEATLQQQITAGYTKTEEAKQTAKDLRTALIETGTVSTRALEHLQAMIAEKSSTKIVEALQQIQTELEGSILSMQREQATLQPQVLAIKALTAGDGDIDAPITPDDKVEFAVRDHQVDANIMHDYEAARHALREQLNIDGLFEEMSKRQAKMQRTTIELDRLQNHKNQLQNEYNQTPHGRVINKMKSIIKRTEEQDTISELEDTISTIKEIDIIHKINDTESGIITERNITKELKDIAASITEQKRKRDNLLVEMTSAAQPTSDYPPSLEKLPAELHDDVKHILDEMRRRQETRDHYLAIIDQQHVLPTILNEIASEAPLYHALQAFQVEQAPNETADAFHQRLMDSLPHYVPEHIQQTEHWQQLQLTYDEFVRTDSPGLEKYVQMKQDALTGLKQSLQTRNELSTHLQKIEEWRRAERDLPHIQQEILTILVDHLSASSLKKLSPEAQTTIRATRDHWRPTSTASKAYQEIPDTDQQQMRTHLAQEVETGAPLSAALQRLMEQPPPFHQTEEVYHQWLIQHFPPNVPEPIRRTTEWQTLLLTYPNYVNTSGPNSQHYIWIKQEAIISLKEHLPEGSEEKIRAEQDRVQIQRVIVDLLSDPSLEKLSSKVRTQLEDIRNHTQPTNETSAPSQELTNQQQQLILQITREIKEETPTYEALQRFTKQTVSNKTPEACHRLLVRLLPHSSPQHVRQTNQWKPLHLTYSEYKQRHPQAQSEDYIKDKLKAATNLTSDLQARNQFLVHLEHFMEKRRENQKLLQTFPQAETEAPLYLALQHLTKQPVHDQMGEAYQWWIAKQLPKEVPEYIQQTEHWQRVQQTYTDYVRNNGPSLPYDYVRVKQEALINLRNYLQDRYWQLIVHLPELAESRTAHQNMLETDQWSTLNRQADTLLQQLSTTSGSNRDT